MKLTSTTKRGDIVTLRLVGPGELLGLAGIIADVPSPVSARVVLPSRVASVALQPFLHFCTKHPEAGRWLAVQISLDLLEAWRHQRLLLEPNVNTKILQLLFLWAETHGRRTGEGTSLDVSQQDVAETLGTSRETVNRLFARLKRRGIIRVAAGGGLLLAGAVNEQTYI